MDFWELGLGILIFVFALQNSSEKKSGFFNRFKKGLEKTQKLLNTNLSELFKTRPAVREVREQLEELLITSDLGVKTSFKLIEELERKIKKEAELEQVRQELYKIIFGILKPLEKPLEVPPDALKPFAIMVVGVNGTGKTTTIGKLAMRFKKQGYRVLLSAGDTFRAAGIEQLEEWAKRAGADIVKHKEGADPGAVCFDAIKAGISRGVDVVIMDTAGRLHTKTPLMEELKKVKRVSEKALGRALDEIILVLDATTGQNALEQAKVFSKELSLSGIILTKLDGTAKGGIIIAIADQLQIPIRMVGLGEGIEDLEQFRAEEFTKALLGLND